MNIENEKEISVEQFKVVVIKYWFYFLSKWKWIISVAIIAGIAGIVYASFKKPVYIAEITFVGESEGSATLGGYAGLAAQFGIDAGGSSGAFAGDNLIELMHSKLLIEKTLLSN
ncbi:MAG TPA: Wzz/FepE/Etk N-terminal domain-containing protein, partial [Segetibacter sp.]